MTSRAISPPASSFATKDPHRGNTSALTMLKGLSILEHRASQTEPLAVGEIAVTLGLEKSTVSRLLSALRTAGYVRQRRDRRYLLTSKLLFLTRNFLPAEHLRDVTQRAVATLHESLDEAVHVAAIDEGEIVFVNFLDSSRSVRSRTPTSPSPLHLTAIGCAALSQMNDRDRSRALHHSARAADVPIAMVDTSALQQSLDDAHQRGFASYDRGDDVTRIASAILDASGNPVGGISVSGPAYRLDQRIEEIGESLVETTSVVVV